MEGLPTVRELQILKILWQREAATVREVYEVLRPEGGALAYTTILTLMQNMEQKGLVTKSARGKAHVYRPAVAQGTTVGQLTDGFLDRVFDGALNQFVVRALESRRPSLQELDELEQMIAAAKRKARGENASAEEP